VSLGPILAAALAAQAAYEAIGLRGCVIGGVALQRWGEPRFTADAPCSPVCPHASTTQQISRSARV